MGPCSLLLDWMLPFTLSPTSYDPYWKKTHLESSLKAHLVHLVSVTTSSSLFNALLWSHHFPILFFQQHFVSSNRKEEMA